MEDYKMGNFKIVGFTSGLYEITPENIALPENAIKVTHYANDLNIFYCFLSVTPIIVLILLFLFINLKKHNLYKDFESVLKKFIKKDISTINRKKLVLVGFAFLLFITIILFLYLCFCTILHESIHAFFECLFGKNVIIGFDISSMIGYVKSLSSIYTKSEKIIILIMPFMLLGFLPVIICFYLLKKSYKKIIISILIILSCSNIAICCSDLIDVYNYIRYIPNNTTIQFYNNETYFF